MGLGFEVDQLPIDETSTQCLRLDLKMYEDASEQGPLTDADLAEVEKIKEEINRRDLT